MIMCCNFASYCICLLPFSGVNFKKIADSQTMEGYVQESIQAKFQKTRIGDTVMSDIHFQFILINTTQTEDCLPAPSFGGIYT